MDNDLKQNCRKYFPNAVSTYTLRKVSQALHLYMKDIDYKIGDKTYHFNFNTYTGYITTFKLDQNTFEGEAVITYNGFLIMTNGNPEDLDFPKYDEYSFTVKCF
jgi:hypothetical protein